MHRRRSIDPKALWQGYSDVSPGRDRLAWADSERRITGRTARGGDLASTVAPPRPTRGWSTFHCSQWSTFESSLTTFAANRAWRPSKAPEQKPLLIATDHGHAVAVSPGMFASQQARDGWGVARQPILPVRRHTDSRISRPATSSAEAADKLPGHK